MVAGFRDVEDRVARCGHAGCDEQRADATFEACEAVFDDLGGRVVEARVDRAELAQRETVRCRFGVREDVRVGQVDR